MNLVNDSGKQIKVGTFLSYVQIMIEILSGMIYTPWMVKQIGVADYGMLVLATSLITFFALDFGLGIAVTRFLSKFKAEDNKEAESKVLGVSFKLYMILSSIIFLILLILFFFIENIYDELTPFEIEKLKVIYIIFGIFTVVSFPFMPFQGILISNERFVFIKLLEIMKTIVSVFLMAISLLLGYGLYALVLVSVFVGLIKIVIQFIYVKKKSTTKVNFNYQDKTLYKELIVFSAWTTATVVAQRFILNITPIILGILAEIMQIAVFSIGMKIENYTYFLANAVGGLSLPEVSRLTTNNQYLNELERFNNKIGRIQLFIVSIIVAGFVSMGKEFMFLWMGYDFSNSYYVTMLLIIPNVITLTLPVANNALLATNRIKYNGFSFIITAIISFSLSLIFSRYYGAIGAAASIFIGNVIGKVIYLNIVYHKVLKINMFGFFKECHYKMISPFFITLAAGVAIQRFWRVESMLFFMIKAILIAVLYFFLCWFIYFNQYEKKLFLGVFNILRERCQGK